MLLDDKEVEERIESPINLLNRLKTSLTRTVNSHNIPTMPPKASDVITDLEDKIRDSSTRSKAAGILNSAMDELKNRLPEVQRPEKLAAIAHEMSKIIANHDSNGNRGAGGSQIIVYAPQVHNIEEYNIVDVRE